MLLLPAPPAAQAQPYYELTVPDSDEEYEPASADASGMTGVERDTASGLAGPTLSTASDAGTAQHEHGEVEQRAQQDGQLAAAAAQQQEQEQQQAPAAAHEAAAGGTTSSAGTAVPPAPAAAPAGADAAAQETSSKSEETAVPEAGAEGLSLPPLQAGGAAARGSKDVAEHSSPRKRSRRRPGGLADAAVEPSADTAVQVAVS